MRLSLKQFVAIQLFILLWGNLALGESSFDFFFKNNEQYKDVIVEEVLSTDTFRLKDNTGEKGKVIKLIGLRVPGSPKKKKNIERDDLGIAVREPVTPETPLEEKAFEFTRELLEGQHVRLEFDAEKLGENNETLAYVFLLKDNTFVNKEILRQGFAHLSIHPLNMKYSNELREAYKEARNEQRGLQG